MRKPVGKARLYIPYECRWADKEFDREKIEFPLFSFLMYYSTRLFSYHILTFGRVNCVADSSRIKHIACINIYAQFHIMRSKVSTIRTRLLHGLHQLSSRYRPSIVLKSLEVLSCSLAKQREPEESNNNGNERHDVVAIQ